MPVEFTTLNLTLNFHFTADTMQELAPCIGVIACSSRGRHLVAQLTAGTMDELLDAIAVLAQQMDDPDWIAAIRVDEEACSAELDVAARPVDPRRLH